MQVSLLPPRTIHRNDISTSRYNAERTLCHPFETRLAGEWTGRGSVEKKRRRKKKKGKKKLSAPTELPMIQGGPFSFDNGYLLFDNVSKTFPRASFPRLF